MREIKFRAWDREEKSMKNWNHLMNDISYGSNRISDPEIEDNIFNDPDFILMQFTGLHDKNGTRIDEDDTLKQSPGFGCEWGERTGTVKYQGASFWFDIGGQAFVLDDHDCQFEVIGNIYENPELIRR